MCKEDCKRIWEPCNGSCSHDDNLHLCGDICTESPCSSCHTVSGPDTGSPCVFPFIADGHTFIGCVDDGKGRSVCATQVDSSGVLTNYGYCNDDCIRPNITLSPEQCKLGWYMCGNICTFQFYPHQRSCEDTTSSTEVGVLMPGIGVLMPCPDPRSPICSEKVQSILHI